MSKGQNKNEKGKYFKYLKGKITKVNQLYFLSNSILEKKKDHNSSEVYNACSIRQFTA